VLFGISASGVYGGLRTWTIRGPIGDVWGGYLKKPFQFVYPVVLIMLVLLAAYPSVTGAVIWDQYNYNIRSMQVKVPAYWPRLGDWFLKNDPHARVFILPKTGYARAPYDWESGFTSATTAAISFLPNQLAYHTDFPTTRAQKLCNDLFAFFAKDNAEDMSHVLKALGVKYVLQQNDISWKFAWPDTLSPDEAKGVLGSRHELAPMQSFGKLDIYRVRDPGSLFAVSPEVNVLVGADIHMFDVARKGMLGKPYMVMDSLKAAQEFAGKGVTAGVIEWDKPAGAVADTGAVAGTPAHIRDIRRIHPGKYVIDLSAETPFWLVFNETYHPGWEARFGEKKRSSWYERMLERSMLACWARGDNRLPRLEHHMRLNEYANGWFVDRTGDIRVVVEYGPQRIYELAKLVSWCCGLLCLLLMGRAFLVR